MGTISGYGDGGEGRMWSFSCGPDGGEEAFEWKSANYTATTVFMGGSTNSKDHTTCCRVREEEQVLMRTESGAKGCVTLYCCREVGLMGKGGMQQST